MTPSQRGYDWPVLIPARVVPAETVELTEGRVISRWHGQYGPFSVVVQWKKLDEPMRKAIISTVHALREHGHAAPEAGAITIPAPHGPEGIPENQADADCLREAARTTGDVHRSCGSNLRATMVKFFQERRRRASHPGRRPVTAPVPDARPHEIAVPVI